MRARKKDESSPPKGWAVSPETQCCTGEGEGDHVSELCRKRVWDCDPSEDPVGRQIVETHGAANPEVWELQEKGGKTRWGKEGLPRGVRMGRLGRA